MKIRILLLVWAIVMGVGIGLCVGARAQGVDNLNVPTPVVSSSTFSAGAANTGATIAAVGGQYSCAEQVVVHMDVSTAVVTGDVTVTGVKTADGTNTVHIRCVDTTNAGAWCPWDGPVLQSTDVNTAIVVHVPAMTNGGAGDAYVAGYTRAGGCR